MRILLRGKSWKLSFAPLKQLDGFCDDPTTRRKRIQVSSALTEPRTLEVLIHEMLHACSWDTAEEAVDESARDIAAVLWKLGYRRQDGQV